MKESLSIAMLSHLASAESPTGAERSLADLACGLRARGHRVLLVVPGAWALSEEARDAGVGVVRVGCRSCWLTYHEPLPPLRTWLKWARFLLPDPGRRRIERVLRALDPDVVHVNCLPHVRGAAAAHASGAPVCWHVREILPPGRRRRWFSERLRRSSRRIVAVSEAVADWLRAEGLGELVEVVPNGVAVPDGSRETGRARAALSLPEDGFLIGLFGQLRPHKGVLEFVEAARLALAEEPSLRFVVAGAGPPRYLSRVRAAIGSGPAARRIHLLPPQPSAESLVAAVDAVCLATLTPDPFPRAVLEAMASGVPVAAFAGGGVGEMVTPGETGLLVGPGDLRGLVSALIRLGRDREASRRMGEAARLRAVREFSRERHLDRMERLLRELAEGR